MDPAERLALVASARRKALLYTHRHMLRHEDLEDCFSQATFELIRYARAGGVFGNERQVAALLELRFLSRVRDRCRAIAGRSPIQAALESALARGGWCDLQDMVHAYCPVQELVMLRVELGHVPRLARELTDDQRLVVACQVGLQMGRSEFCALFGWSKEKYRKVAQRARARLRALSEELEENELDVPPALLGSDREMGTHL